MIISSSPFFKEYRCNCGKLLFKSPVFSGIIEVKCRRCGLYKLFVKDRKKVQT